MGMPHSDTRLWHPFADMNAVRSSEVTIVSGEGVHVTDDEGRRYLDGTASLWNVNVGHGRQELADAAAEQMRQLATYSCFGAFANPPALELAERLCALAPVDGARVFLTSGGGDSIDTAAKLARRYFAAIGQPERVHLISRSQGYHGTHGLGTSLGGIPANRVDVGPLDPHSSQVPHDSLEALEAEIERVGADRVAAVFVEPVIGAGGVHPPQPGYIEGVDALCKRTGVLHVVDAVIAGFGRLGEWFGPERWGIRPDMITFAKGVTSGYLPLGGVIVERRHRGAVLGRGERALVPPRPDLLRPPDLLRGRAREPRHHRARGPARAGAGARGRADRGAVPRSPRTRSSARSAAAPARWPPSRCRARCSPSTPRRRSRSSARPASAACWCGRSATASRCHRR